MPVLAAPVFMALSLLFASLGPHNLPIVALDAGHGGEQAGARGVCGVWEKDITLQVAQRVARVLAASGRVQPLLIRETDVAVPLPARSERALAGHADIFISIHANASTSAAAHGIETFFLALGAPDRRLRRLAERENDGRTLSPASSADPLAMVLRGLSLDAAHAESQALAIALQRAMVSQLHSRGRGVLQAPFMVLFGARMPAALVEVGFITHPDECVRLRSEDGQEAIAQALAAGILTHVAVGRIAHTAAADSGSPRA